MSKTRNFEEYRAEVLSKLGAEAEDVRNFAKFRKKVFEGLGVSEYTTEDLRNEERYRLKVLENLSGGGGGSSDFSTAQVTVINNKSLDIVALYGAWINQWDGGFAMHYNLNVDAGQTVTVLLVIGGDGMQIHEMNDAQPSSINGDAEDWEYGDVNVTGDCTLTYGD